MPVKAGSGRATASSPHQMALKSTVKCTWNDILLTLDTPTIASKRWVYRQYDHQVQNNTLILPVTQMQPDPIRLILIGVRGQGQSGKMQGVAATVDCNSLCISKPYEGAKAVVAEAARNLSCGAEPLAVTDNLTLGSPEKPLVTGS